MEKVNIPKVNFVPNMLLQNRNTLYIAISE